MHPADNDAVRMTATLIHGTFARRAAWIGPDGSIATALRARYGEAVQVVEFRWSGKNSTSARHTAALDLADHLLTLSRTYPNARHYLVAHSHGGNVALYAAASEPIRQLIEGVVTLATPFIVCRERNLGPVDLFGRAFVFVFMVPVLLVTVLAVELWFPRPTIWGQSLVGTLTGGVAYLPLIILWFVWMSASQKLHEQLQHGTLTKERLLVLRGVADEASLSITAFGVLSMLSNSVARAVARLAEGARRLPSRVAASRSWAAYVFMIGGLLAAGAIAWGVYTRFHVSAYTGYVVFWLLCHFFVAPFGAVALGFEDFDSTPAYIYGLVGVPAMALATIGMLPFGWRIALANLALDVTVESSPVGTYEVALLIPEATTQPGRAGPLLHSALYDDPTVIERIVEFVGRSATAILQPATAV